jgi:hypothetical protein
MRGPLPPVPPPRIGWRARLLKPVLFGLLRLHRWCDRWLGGVEPPETRRTEADFDVSTGPLLERADCPLLYSLLDHLDKRMGGVRPSEVRLGVLPACGVAETRGAHGAAKQTLILGLPCFAIWSVDELSSVIAHEMAHLKLEDAVFTREVVQTAARLAQAKGPRRLLARAVGRTVGRYAASVCRDMEFRADRWSAACFRAETLAGAVEKLLVVQPIFRLVMLQKEQAFAVEDTVFDHFARTWNNLPLEKFWELRSKLAVGAEVKPLDPHPSIMERLNRLAKMRTSLAPPPAASAMNLLVQPEGWKRMLHNRVYRSHETKPTHGTVFYAASDRESR